MRNNNYGNYNIVGTNGYRAIFFERQVDPNTDLGTFMPVDLSDRLNAAFCVFTAFVWT
ncbi:hypothetical protein ISN44_As03g041170 [Arabidopsis suecica]|uniref:Uncharacterized protein n=1 Tax=Arabidopsis suecica TaxID=45249 RepID=A0A8T2FFZ1_ARASU|nr:hypothetical protein ISN44_As03g041170 [Arabidopsis suecica]